MSKWNSSRITTVGELLAALSDIPPETPVLSSWEDGTLDDIFFEYHEKDGSSDPEFIVLNTPPEVTCMTQEEQSQIVKKWNQQIEKGQ